MGAWAKPVRIACIVEGDGEEAAMPLLVRRIARDMEPLALVEPFLSQRIPKSRLVGKPPYLENAIEFAARGAGTSGAILLVVDADDDCPAAVGPALLQRARKARADVPSAVVLAKRFPPLTVEELTSLAAFEIALRPCLNGITVAPVTGLTLPLGPVTRDAHDLAAVSRARHGQARAEVEAALRARIQVNATRNSRFGREAPGGIQ